MKVTYTMDVDCSPALLWGYLEEPSRMRRWMKGLESVEHVGGAPGQAATLRFKQGKRVTDCVSTVVSRAPFNHLTILLSGGSCGGKVMRVEYALADLGGKTRLDYSCAMQDPSILMKVVGFLFGPLIRKQFTGWMTTLKREAETEAGHALAA